MTPHNEQPATLLHAREELLRTLRALIAQGSVVLVHGPIGIGKSAILRALASWARASGRRCGFALRTERFEDVAGAIAGAYPETADFTTTQYGPGSDFRRALEMHPGVLLLDDVVEASPPLMGFLRASRGSGLGVVLAVDVEHPREQIPARRSGLVDREIAIPRMHGVALRRILAERLTGLALPNELVDADRSALLVASEGRPGKLVAMLEHLTVRTYWHEGRIRLGPLLADVTVALSRPPVRGLMTPIDTRT